MAKHPEVGEVVPIMDYMGRLRPKGYFCQASSIWKGREICHFGIYYDLKGLQKDFFGSVKKLVVEFNDDSEFTAVKRCKDLKLVCERGTRY